MAGADKGDEYLFKVLVVGEVRVEAELSRCGAVLGRVAHLGA
jgi:hypothetical protein